MLVMRHLPYNFKSGAKQRALHETPLKVKCRARRISFVAPKIFKIG